MNGLHNAWSVARREIHERLRSPVYYVSLALMLVAVVGALLAPTLFDTDHVDEVGLTGQAVPGLGAAIEAQADAADVEVRLRDPDTLASGEAQLRDGDLDVLVVDGRRLLWLRTADEELKAVVTGAIRSVALRDRAAAAGIDSATLQELLAPVPVPSEVIGQVAGRSEDDETATYVLSLLLFLAVSVYGGMVLTGVVEEKSTRVVEVLLARIPPWSLLAGKIAGIGLLGLTQVAVTGVGAVVALSVTDTVDLPAARTSVIVWAIVWFVLGYSLIATAYGLLGSLTSRSEDASSVTGPLTVVLIAAYFAAFATIGSPDEWWARLVSWFPITAPFAMPNRIAMGGAAWWEPYLAAALTTAAIAALVALGGRIYSHAILRTGAVVRIVEAWRGTAESSGHPAASRWVPGVLAGAAACVGAVVALVSRDVIVGVAAGAATFALATRLRKARR